MNTSGPIPAAPIPEAKKALTFANIKVSMGMCAVVGKLSYGMHLTGVLTEEKKSAFSVLSTKPDSTKDIQIDTFIFINPDSPKAIAEIVEADPKYNWFFGKETTPTLPTGISNEVKKLVLKDVNKWKGMYSSSKPYQPLPTDTNINTVIDELSKQGHIDTLIEFYAQLQKELAKDKKASSSVDLDEFIQRYAFKEHILLSGAAGTSKTWSADAFITANKWDKEFVAGHPGIEATDLLGYPIRHTDGSFVWMDGPLTAAFRRAQTTKTALFIDELLRIPARELNILIGALTPNSSKQFVLRTNRLTDINDGIGKSETLVIPVENLWVIATTNLGSNYNVEDMDLALNDRFITHDVSIADDTIVTIIEVNNINSLDAATLDRTFKLMKAVNALVSAGELTHPMNVRHITKVIRNVTDSKQMKSFWFDMAPNICSRNTEGALNASELQIYKDTIKSLF